MRQRYRRGVTGPVQGSRHSKTDQEIHENLFVFLHWWAQRNTRTTSLIPRESRAQFPGTATPNMPRRRGTRESRREFCPRASHCSASGLCTARAAGRPASLAKTDGQLACPSCAMLEDSGVYYRLCLRTEIDQLWATYYYSTVLAQLQLPNADASGLNFTSGWGTSGLRERI